MVEFNLKVGIERSVIEIHTQVLTLHRWHIIFTSGVSRFTEQALYLHNSVGNLDSFSFHFTFWHFRVSTCVVDYYHFNVPASKQREGATAVYS